MNKRGYSCIALDNPNFDSNVGGALRAAQCYGADLAVISGDKFKKESTDTMKAYKHIPTILGKNIFDNLPYDCIPVAVDLIEGAIALPKYGHPERAFYIFGPENSTLGKEITDRCQDIVYVPTEFCMNLAATVNVVLYDRLFKSRNYKAVEEIISHG